MSNSLAVILQFISVAVLIVGIFLVIYDSSERLYSVACIGNALFMYGFAYLVEAASLYDKEKKERKKILIMKSCM